MSASGDARTRGNCSHPKAQQGCGLPDIKPRARVASLDREKHAASQVSYTRGKVARVTGMSESFISRVCGRQAMLSVRDVLALLDQDAYGETYVPRSMVLDYLHECDLAQAADCAVVRNSELTLINGHVLDTLRTLPRASVKCVVTSTPYWGLRVYKSSYFARWADGEVCPFGHEQTPEGFIRHSVEVLESLYDVLEGDASVWWNVMDSYNTRTQVRGNAAEALRAMQGRDRRSWADHACRRYSAGHSYLKDGEQCIIPGQIAERASRMGYYVKAVITWAKTATLPEPQVSRVSRNLEYVLHLAKVRTPHFDKGAYRRLPPALGGRNSPAEADKLSDVWILPTSSGRDGHGAQFPLALPGRCIGLTTRKGDLVLDPFVGAGNAGVAAVLLGRRFVGIDVSKEYLETAGERIARAKRTGAVLAATRSGVSPRQGTLL